MHYLQHTANPPRDLITHFIALCDFAFRTHLSTESLSDTYYIQDIYSIICARRCLTPATSRAFARIRDIPNAYRFAEYLWALLDVQFMREAPPFEALLARTAFIGFMGDDKRSGVLHCDERACNARMARGCMNLLLGSPFMGFYRK